MNVPGVYFIVSDGLFVSEMGLDDVQGVHSFDRSGGHTYVYTHTCVCVHVRTYVRTRV